MRTIHAALFLLAAVAASSPSWSAEGSSDAAARVSIKINSVEELASVVAFMNSLPDGALTADQKSAKSLLLERCQAAMARAGSAELLAEARGLLQKKDYATALATLNAIPKDDATTVTRAAKSRLLEKIFNETDDIGLIESYLNDTITTGGAKGAAPLGIELVGVSRTLYDHETEPRAAAALARLKEAVKEGSLSGRARSAWAKAALCRESDEAVWAEAVAALRGTAPQGEEWEKAMEVVDLFGVTFSKSEQIGTLLGLRRMDKHPQSVFRVKALAKAASLPSDAPYVLENTLYARKVMWAKIETGDLKSADVLIGELLARGESGAEYAAIYNKFMAADYAGAIAVAKQFYDSLKGTEQPRDIAKDEAYLWTLVFQWRSEEALGLKDDAGATAKRIVDEWPGTPWARIAAKALAKGS